MSAARAAVAESDDGFGALFGSGRENPQRYEQLRTAKPLCLDGYRQPEQLMGLLRAARELAGQIPAVERDAPASPGYRTAEALLDGLPEAEFERLIGYCPDLSDRARRTVAGESYRRLFGDWPVSRTLLHILICDAIEGRLDTRLADPRFLFPRT